MLQREKAFPNNAAFTSFLKDELQLYRWLPWQDDKKFVNKKTTFCFLTFNLYSMKIKNIPKIYREQPLNKLKHN